MGAFVLVFHRDGAPVDVALVSRLLGTLSHRGPDSSSSLTSGPFGLGSQAFWTTPEEDGERQPLLDPAQRFAVLLDGRLDNREELLAALDERPSCAMSDAALVLAAFQRWGSGCFARFLGPFAACLVDLGARKVTLARDHLGDRTVFYHVSDSLLVVGSEQAAVLAHPAVSQRLDETTVARHFAIRPPLPGRTFHTAVREVLPAQTVEVDPRAEARTTFWSPPEERPARGYTDEDLIQEFRHLLTQSVRSRLRTVGEPAAQLSGGLDSTAVAALAGADTARVGFPRPLRTISWVFDELRSCDERRWIDAMVTHCGFDSIRFAGDGCWPMRDYASWPHSPNEPDVNAFRLLKSTAFSHASSRGHRVLLIGASGDDVYLRWPDAFVSMLQTLRLATLAREFVLAAQRVGIAGLRRHPSVRGLGGRALDALGRRRWRSRRGASPAPHWLTPRAAEMLSDTGELDATDPRLDPRGHPCVALDTSWGVSHELPSAARCGVELRDPFRDRRVVELALRLPAHILLRNGREKHLVRAATHDVLPEVVRDRITYTPLGALYRRGMARRELATLRALLLRDDSTWPRFVRGEPVRAALESPGACVDDGALGLLAWYCASFERWVYTDSRGTGMDKLDNTSRSAPPSGAPSGVTVSAIVVRRSYAPPSVDWVEPLHVAVLGGSPGINDSGSAGARKPPTGGAPSDGSSDDSPFLAPPQAVGDPQTFPPADQFGPPAAPPPPLEPSTD